MGEPISNEIVHKPSADELDIWLRLWDEEDIFKNYRIQCKCLEILFKDKFKNNSNFDEVLAKVAVLNDFYSTNIYKPAEVAQRIIDYKKKQNKDFDKDLKGGEKGLVDVVRGKDYEPETDGEKVIDCYSFATKYCSFHNPNEYQIYDSFCEKFLEYWLNEDKDACDEFKEILNEVKKSPKQDNNRTKFGYYCREYKQYMDVIDAFIEYYNLKDSSKYNRVNVDRYIWLAGKYYFPKQYEISAAKAAEKIKGIKEFSSNLKIKGMKKEYVTDIKKAVESFVSESEVRKLTRVLKLSGLGEFKKDFNGLEKKHKSKENGNCILIFPDSKSEKNA